MTTSIVSAEPARAGALMPRPVKSGLSLAALLTATVVLALMVAAAAVTLPIALAVTAMFERPSREGRPGWQPVAA